MEEFPSCLSQKCGVDTSAGNVPLEKGHQQSCPRKGYRVELHCRVRKVWHKPASRSFISVLASLRELWVWEDQSAWWAFKAQGCLFPYTSYPPLFQSSVCGQLSTWCFVTKSLYLQISCSWLLGDISVLLQKGPSSGVL